ncbi:MAG: hypothetical protein KIS74_02970 [Burkholderiales bacterium]|nr:hypothetical protein [Burkholderiales bacterium]
MTRDRAARLAAFAEAVVLNTWTFAKTMPQNPHEYALRARWDSSAMAWDDFVMTIRELGYTERWLDRRQYTYLKVGEWKYWTMGGTLAETSLVNRARVEA